MSADTLDLLGTLVLYLIVFPALVMTGFISLVRYAGRNDAADTFAENFIPHPEDVAAIERQRIHEGWL